MSVAEDIYVFSRTRDVWQQDLIRRLCTSTEITDSDLEEVLLLLKAEKKVDQSGQAAVPLGLNDLSANGSASAKVVLGGLSGAQHVNRLASGQTLLFATEGLTICYGDNGSGKTGYCRILKQLCRVRRERPEPILPDVYAKASKQPARATVTYLIDGQLQTPHLWQEGASGPLVLSRISVFDAGVAPLYADKQNEIEFLPHGLDVLPRLAKACEQLQQRLDGELSTLKRVVEVPLTTVTVGTAAAGILESLNLLTPPAELPTPERIRAEAAWNADDDLLLREADAELQALSEPAKNAAALERMARVCESVADSLFALDDVISDRNVESVRDQKVRATELREAATLAASVRFANEPLRESIGSAPWRRMYESAREFARLAYPGTVFPSTDDGQVCVLCEQPLSKEAADRLRRFDEFLLDNSEASAKREEDALNRRLSVFEHTQVPAIEVIETQFREYTDTQDDGNTLVASVRSFLDAARQRLGRIRQAAEGEASFEELPPAPTSLVAKLKAKALSLRQAAQDLLKNSADCDQILKKAQHRDALIARKQLSKVIDAVLQRRSDIQTYHSIRLCRDACDTRSISVANSKLREKYLTGSFSQQLEAEIERLGISYLPLKLETRTDRGASLVGVGLSKINPAKNSAILSEGEFRALALACFLTEIAMIPDHNGIIVDDPVTSLDHLHIREVAARLVEEARKRQVIIFTHNLSFYYELLHAATVADVPLFENWVFKEDGQGCGIVSQDKSPWQVKKVNERLAYLDEMLKNIPDQAACTRDEYLDQVVTFYRSLRETWERTVEEVVLAGVVARFQPGVKTQSLKCVCVTDDDYKTVFLGMKKASEYSGHDRPVSREGVPPSVQEMRTDLTRLREYVKAAKKRAQDAARDREKLEVPRKAATVSMQ